MNPFTVYASPEVHGCVDKSVEELGIGSDQRVELVASTYAHSNC